MCGGGKGAAKRAEAAEIERKRQVARSSSAINTAFAGRSGQLDDFVAALREEFGAEATRQKADSDRSLKFALARGGLTGGSAAADAGARSGREFESGILKGERLSQAALADLVSSDAASKQNLLALAQSGASTTTAATSAAEALRANISGAKANASLDSLGDIFGDTRTLIEQREEAAERRRGLKESELFAAPFSRAT